jgi:transposase-like protein
MNNAAPIYHGYRFPPEIISHAVWLYNRFSLSFRDQPLERGEDFVARNERQWRWMRARFAAGGSAG